MSSRPEFMHCRLRPSPLTRKSSEVGLGRRLGEEFSQWLERRVPHHENIADAVRQDKCDPAVADFFVLAHKGDQAIGRETRQRNICHARRQTLIFKMTAYP